MGWLKNYICGRLGDYPCNSDYLPLLNKPITLDRGTLTSQSFSSILSPSPYLAN